MQTLWNKIYMLIYDNFALEGLQYFRAYFNSYKNCLASPLNQFSRFLYIKLLISLKLYWFIKYELQFTIY